MEAKKRLSYIYFSLALAPSNPQSETYVHRPTCYAVETLSLHDAEFPRIGEMSIIKQLKLLKA